MKLSSTLAALLTVVGASACGGPSPGSENKAVGKLELALVGVDRAGHQYRLRDATFQISGYAFNNGELGFGGSGIDPDSGVAPPFSKAVSSETDLADPVIDVSVLPGNYTVELAGDAWYIEELQLGSPTRVEKAVLVSERSQYAWVYDGGVTPVVFRFGVGSDNLIDFRSGSIRICAEFEQPGDPGIGVAGRPAFGGYPGSGCDPYDRTVGGAGSAGAFAPPSTAGVGGGRQ